MLNVATTRLILTRGGEHGLDAAGGVIRAFGEFVAGDQVVVGAILFAILVVIQFVVITKGATRISEVAARFMLDGLPGRQMAIDADLHAGLIDQHEAVRRREAVYRQADFFGAMDGAGKFVRGDAVAGVLITFVNILGGLYLGVVQHGMSLGEAVEVFTKLTIGDGLVSQVPAFLISLAAGLIVTRSSTESDLGREVTGQLFGRPEVLGVASGFLLLLSFSGLPAVPLLTLAAALAAGAVVLAMRKEPGAVAESPGAERAAPPEWSEPSPSPTPPATEPPSDRMEDLLQVDPLELEIGYRLIALSDPSRGDLLERIRGVRHRVARELGLIVPQVRIRDEIHLGPHEYRLKIRGAVVGQGVAYAGRLLAVPPSALVEPPDGRDGIDPTTGQPAVWIHADGREVAELAGCRVLEAAAVVAGHFGEVVLAHADELLTHEQVRRLLDRARQQSRGPGRRGRAGAAPGRGSSARLAEPRPGAGQRPRPGGDPGGPGRASGQDARHRRPDRARPPGARSADRPAIPGHRRPPAGRDGRPIARRPPGRRGRARRYRPFRRARVRRRPRDRPGRCRGRRRTDRGGPAPGRPLLGGGPPGAQGPDPRRSPPPDRPQPARDPARHAGRADRLGRRGRTAGPHERLDLDRPAPRVRRSVYRRERRESRTKYLLDEHALRSNIRLLRIAEKSRMPDMSTKTYRAGTMKEALEQVRRDLGGGAVILGSREVRRRRLFGLGGRELIEVTATTDPAAASEGDESRGGVGSGAIPPTGSGALHAQVGEQLSRLHAMVESLSRQGRLDHLLPELPSGLAPTYATLLEAEVPEVLARRLVRHVAERLEPDEAHRPEALREALRGAVEACVPIAPPIAAVPGTRRIVALVGPTGVGKTTTVAKLAANFKLVQGLRPGLVTVDTYRIAAVEQLRTYAEIIGLPLAVANAPNEMRGAIDALGEVDLVLIDTAGRSPRDEVRIRELADFLAEARPDEVHLVLSAVAGERSLRAAVERFAVVRADRLILTKLDEADGLGGVLAVIGQANRPVSYLTTGQAVPDDIEPADRRRLAGLILGHEVVG